MIDVVVTSGRCDRKEMLNKKGDAKKLNRVFSHPLLQRWSAHLWQNGMVEARSGIMNEG